MMATAVNFHWMPRLSRWSKPYVRWGGSYIEEISVVHLGVVVHIKLDEQAEGDK